MKRRLNLWLDAPCPVRERLQEVDGGWSCETCQHHVRDLTAASETEIQQAFEASQGELCAAVWADGDGRVSTRRAWSLGAAALALTVLGVDASAAAMDSTKQERRRPPPLPPRSRRLIGRISPHSSTRHAPAPNPDGHGVLNVESIPWARFFLDGVDTEQNTPIRDLRVPSGIRRVGLRAANTLALVEFTVDVHPGEVVRVVRRL